MMLSLAEEQADGIKSGFVNYIQSEEFETKLATKMDKAVNIPFTSDQREEAMFRELADILTDILAGLVGD